VQNFPTSCRESQPSRGEDLERRGAKMCLHGRRADAREVAYPILSLASDEAPYGFGLTMDGGHFTK
jgi:hypothetical protein